ncbi:MAG: YfiR family protein [Catalinimonas sp.]
MKFFLPLLLALTTGAPRAWSTPPEREATQTNVAKDAATKADAATVAENENLIYSVFIYHFTKYVKWPADNRYSSGDFVIGVLGNTQMMSELQKIAATKKVDDRQIVIRQYQSVGEIDDICHMLYLPPGASDEFENAEKKVRYASTLLITHRDGLGTAGSQINFIKQEGKPRFELNEISMAKKQLRFAVALKSIAVVL